MKLTALLSLSLAISFSVQAQQHVDDSIDMLILDTFYQNEHVVPSPEHDDMYMIPEPIFLPLLEVEVKEAHGIIKKPAVPERYDRVFSNPKLEGFVFVEVHPDAQLKHIHILNQMGYEVKCYKQPENRGGLVQLNLCDLPAGRYTLVLDGPKSQTRDINIAENAAIALLN
jgi:hypothetical protein